MAFMKLVYLQQRHTQGALNDMFLPLTDSNTENFEQDLQTHINYIFLKDKDNYAVFYSLVIIDTLSKWGEQTCVPYLRIQANDLRLWTRPLQLGHSPTMSHIQMAFIVNIAWNKAFWVLSTLAINAHMSPHILPLVFSSRYKTTASLWKIYVIDCFMYV